jgi:hypothetical protein
MESIDRGSLARRCKILVAIHTSPPPSPTNYKLKDPTTKLYLILIYLHTYTSSCDSRNRAGHVIPEEPGIQRDRHLPSDLVCPDEGRFEVVGPS